MKNRILFMLITSFCCMLLNQGQVYASHLKIENPLVSVINPEKKAAKVQFDISWDNSWKDDINCDGAWVFAKFKLPNGNWKHLTLKDESRRPFNHKDQSTGFTSKGSDPNLGIWIPAEKTGAFIFRAKEGKGPVNSKNVTLVWDYATDNVLDNEVPQAMIKVFGLEMVYVPQDKHYVGDPKGPNGPDNCFYAYPDNDAYLIKSESPILVDKIKGALYCDQDNPRSREDVPFTIPEEFPKGYKAFWIMKYELSSRQFVDFLNTLTRKQQQNMVESDISGDVITNYYVKTNTEDEHLRNSIVCSKTGNGTTEPVKFYTYAPARTLNYTSWSNIAAFGDWSGLRPITELEYEKASRGPKEAVVDEGAWGTTDVGRVQTFDGADGSGYEIKIPEKGLVNACLGGGIAPFDVGKKTKPDNPGFEGPISGEILENTRHEGIPERIGYGASYYGVMNLSGNVWERCVTIGHKLGRQFTGIHGDGKLDVDGFADVQFWPGRDGTGAGNRGGVWSSPAFKYLRMALRFAANFPKSEDGKNSGCRLGF
ncbi:MAG: SUMF1/EgtB/PvdO family nonheme iron enzyme [Candidatus Omnitrophica bacterium]|nr:SUMF1/EgtB/PvdO family nonheme iron enzyme [Candidatus Omnitrophota bacterium]